MTEVRKRFVLDAGHRILYQFRGELDESDCKAHIAHTFVVPPGCGGIDIAFQFTPAYVGDVRNLLTLTLFDPNGFRGAGHRLSGIQIEQ